MQSKTVRGFMKRTTQIIFILGIFLILLSACGVEESTPAAEIPTVTPTTTADRCSPENLPDEVAEVNKLMREFDDYSSLASNTPQAQLVVVIPELQRVLREAEEQSVPSCLEPLKKLQIDHMTVVVQTLMAFMSNSDLELVNSGITIARDLHLQYDIELARLLGVTLAVAPPPEAVQATPAGDSAAPMATLASTGGVVTNPGPNGVFIRSAPGFEAEQAGVLAVQASARALGRTVDNEWIQVELPDQPGQTAWVYASLVVLSVPIDQLPVTSP
jgi:hypothetical protein